MLSTLGKKVKIEWNKSWSERSSLGNVVLAGPKILSRIVSFMINPFPNLRRKINEEINRDAFVQIKNAAIDLYHEGNCCQVISQQQLNSGTIKKKKSNGDYTFIYKQHEYRLSPIINNAYQKHITNKEGDKLYCVEGLEKNATHTPVLWINKDGKIDGKYCGKRVKQSISNNIKAIVIVPRSAKTGKVIFPLLPLTFTTGVAAIIIKMVGSVLKNILDIPGNLLCKAQDKLSHGVDLKYTAEKYDAIESNNENSKLSITALSQFQYALGTIFGVIGNSLKLVGTTLNETLKFSSAIISSPSALCSQMSRTVKKEHLIVASKSFFQNIKISGIELLNSATKSVENIDGRFANETEKITSSMKEQKIKENTVEYGHTKELKQDKSDNNLLEQALLFGKNLLNSGVEIGNSSDRAINFLEEFRGINNSNTEKVIS